MPESLSGPGLVGYVPRALAERLSRDPNDATRPFADAYDGAVLLVDIAGFTALTETLMAVGDSGAETLLNILNVYFGQMTEIIEAHGGDVVDFAGDAIQATWHGNYHGLAHAARLAVQCGLALQTRLESLAATKVQSIAARIAVSVGHLVLANVGSAASRWHHVLLGEPVRNVALAQREAKPGEVVVCETTWRLVATYCTGYRTAAGPVRLVAVNDLVTPAPLPLIETGAEVDRVLSMRIAGFLLDRLRASQREWLAEFRSLTVMFVHLARSGGFERLDELQNAVTSLQKLLTRHGGAIERLDFDDDGVRAVVAFGLPTFSHPDDAARAITAACAIHAAIETFGIEPSIGIASGRLFCGLCGGNRRHQYMIYGSAINLAARLMQIGGGNILCDSATRRAAGATFDFTALRAVSLKGFDEPVPVFRPALRSNASKPNFRHDLFGRANEFHWFARRLDTFADGQGRLIGVEGEPGIGKSRLLEGVADLARARGFEVLKGQTIEFESGEPFFAWRRILAYLATGDANTDIQHVRDAVPDRLLASEPMRTWAPLLNDIAPLGLEESAVTRQMTGPARVESLHEVLAFLIDRCAGGRPLLLIFDDAQWLDPSSIAAIESALIKVPTLLVIVAARPPDPRDGRAFAGLALTDHNFIKLAALPRDGIASLVHHMLGVDEASNALVDFVLERAQGNPFYTEELILAMRDEGLITLAGGICHYDVAAVASGRGPVPDSLKGVIVQRLDRLEPAAQLVVKIASTIGRRFSSRFVRDLHPFVRDETEIAVILENLVAEDFIRIENIAAEREYEFKHAIVQEVAYGLLPYGQRRPLHRGIARRIERSNHSELNAHYTELVWHWERAERYTRAVRYLERAADHALDRYSNRECVDFMTHAKALAEAHNLKIAPKRSARWERLLGDALHELSLFQQASAHYGHALELCGHRLPGTRAALMLGTGREIIVHLRNRLWAPSAITDAEQSRIGALAAHVYERKAEESFFSNDSLAVLHQTLCGLNLAQRSNAIRERMNGSAALAVGLGLVGLRSTARSYARQALDLAKTFGNEPDLAYIHLLIMVLELGLGGWNAVEQNGEAASQLFHKYGDRYRWQSSHILRFYAHFSRGQLLQADALLDELNASVERDTSKQVLAWIRSTELLADLTRRLPDRARIEAVESLIEQPLDRSDSMLCRGIAALARLHYDETDAAIRHADEGLQIICDSDPTVAGGYMYSAAAIAEVYLTLCERKGKSSIASPPYRQARAMCRAFAQYARRLPSYRPAALTMKGRLANLSGRTVRARRLWRRALKAAEQLQMEREMGYAMVQLARQLSPHDPARSERLRVARDLFDRLGATFDKAQVDQWIST